MGEPVIIWPPDGGAFSDYGDGDTGACVDELGYGWVDCSAQYEGSGGILGDSGLACCMLGE